MKHNEHATGTFIDPGQEYDRLYETDEQGGDKEVNRPATARVCKDPSVVRPYRFWREADEECPEEERAAGQT